jgi:hypothetical protein
VHFFEKHAARQTQLKDSTCILQFLKARTHLGKINIWNVAYGYNLTVSKCIFYKKLLVKWI